MLGMHHLTLLSSSLLSSLSLLGLSMQLGLTRLLDASKAALSPSQRASNTLCLLESQSSLFLTNPPPGQRRTSGQYCCLLETQRASVSQIFKLSHPQKYAKVGSSPYSALVLDSRGVAMSPNCCAESGNALGHACKS